VLDALADPAASAQGYLDDPRNEQVRVVNGVTGDVGPYRLDVLDGLR
jgi:hypothetical protein